MKSESASVRRCLTCVCARLTCGRGGARRRSARGALAGGGAHGPLHGARGLGSAVGVRRARGALQGLVHHERLLVHVVALAAAAVRVARVVGLRVVL